MDNSETICALSTPAGQGAIAVIRISGPQAIGIVDPLFAFPEKLKNRKLINQLPNTLHFGKIKAGNIDIDDVVAGIFKSPRSYTGEDIVEISCHGSVFVQQRILELLIENGCRLAKPGEFTLRAFLNGKLDLSQAEAVADLIASSSGASHRLAINQMRGGFSKEINNLRKELLHFISLIELELDFGEEDVEFANRDEFRKLLNAINKLITQLISSFEYGNAVKNGIPVAIIGRTNAGKSTLLNRLLREEKAIVSEIHGTTRDYIEDTIIIDGVQFRFIDTAGLRYAADQIEAEGINRTHQKLRQAEIVIVMIDIAEDPEQVNGSLAFLNQEDLHNKHFLFVLNKSDLHTSKMVTDRKKYYYDKWRDKAEVMDISAKEGKSVDELEKKLVSLAVSRKPSEGEVIVTNVRHFEALKHSSEALHRAIEGLNTNLPADLLAIDIRQVLHYLGEITGEITTDEILGNIFKNFCIGK